MPRILNLQTKLSSTTYTEMLVYKTLIYSLYIKIWISMRETKFDFGLYNFFH